VKSKPLLACTALLAGLALSSGGRAQTCDDGLRCTAPDLCTIGRCIGAPIQCAGDGDICTVEFCNEASGACDARPRVCDDLNPCTDDTCDPVAGCVFRPAADGRDCYDGNERVVAATCVSGTCEVTPKQEGSPCAPDSPCPYACANVPSGPPLCVPTAESEGQPCESPFGACAVNNFCLGGFCAGEFICDDADPCTIDFCNAQGECDALPPSATCDDGEPCTVDTCDREAGCLHEPLADGALCSDGEACTADECIGGVCEGLPLGAPTRTPTATASLTTTATASRSRTPSPTATGSNTPTPTATRTLSNTPTSTPTPTATAQPTATDTDTPEPTATASPTASPAPSPTVTPTPCPGDCNGDGTVTIDELVTGVDIALGQRRRGACAVLDTVPDGRVTIDELITAVRNALSNCR